MKLLSVLAFSLLLVSTTAEAAVITFEGHGNTIFGDEFAGNGLEVGSSGGFDFTSSGDHFHFIDSTAFATLPNSGSGILSEDRNYSITMTAGGALPFSLIGLDFAGNNDNGSTATSLMITGFLVGGGTVSTTIAILSAASFQSVDLAGFGNLTAVVFDGLGGGGGFALDNVEVGAAVATPEPAMMLLLGTSLLGAGVRRWRQKRA
jgi:hypothetical protein